MHARKLPKLFLCLGPVLLQRTQECLELLLRALCVVTQRFEEAMRFSTVDEVRKDATRRGPLLRRQLGQLRTHKQ